MVLPEKSQANPQRTHASKVSRACLRSRVHESFRDRACTTALAQTVGAKTEDFCHSWIWARATLWREWRGLCAGRGWRSRCAKSEDFFGVGLASCLGDAVCADKEGHASTRACAEQLAQTSLRGAIEAEHLRRATFLRAFAESRWRRATCAEQLSKNASTGQLAQSNWRNAICAERLRSATFNQHFRRATWTEQHVQRATCAENLRSATCATQLAQIASACAEQLVQSNPQRTCSLARANSHERTCVQSLA